MRMYTTQRIVACGNVLCGHRWNDLRISRFNDMRARMNMNHARCTASRQAKNFICETGNPSAGIPNAVSYSHPISLGESTNRSIYPGIARTISALMNGALAVVEEDGQNTSWNAHLMSFGLTLSPTYTIS
ncbi:hypothetical protein H2248_010428 [Termitomyces sp. 'cryptogamus']|nr:hypothetical protein H2248_010428 [Termitomyces sp. 'cryptogamus']